MFTKPLISLTLAAAALAVPAAAQAQVVSPAPAPASSATPSPTVSPATPATPAVPTIRMKPCRVVHSRNAGGFAYAECTTVSTNLPGTVSVTYKSNLPTFNPGTDGQWRKQSGRLGLQNGILTIEFAFKHKSVAQVQKTLKVTLSNPTGGATVVYGPAS